MVLIHLGLSMVSPSENVKSVLIPKSIPTDLLDLLTTLNKSPTIRIVAKYLPELVFVIVTDLMPCLFL